MGKSMVMIAISLFIVVFGAFILPYRKGFKELMPVFMAFTFAAFIYGIFASKIDHVFYSFLILYAIATLPAIFWGWSSSINSMKLSNYIYYMLWITAMGSGYGLVIRMELYKLLPDLVPKIIS